MESVWSVSKLSTESVGRCRELVANSVHTADADATQLDSCVASASAVCIGLKTPKRRSYFSAIEEFAGAVCILDEVLEFSVVRHFLSNLYRQHQQTTEQ